MKFTPVNNIVRITTLNVDGEVQPERLMRMGMFSVRRFVIEKYPQIMQKIFEKVVPMEIENSFVRDTITYTGYSSEFEETPQGSYVNEYQAVFHQNLAGDITIKFEKLGEEARTTESRKVTFF